MHQSPSLAFHPPSKPNDSIIHKTYTYEVLIILHFFLKLFYTGPQNKVSDLDIIFGDSSSIASYGAGKFTRSGGSLSDAELIFGASSTASYKTDRFGSSKSMSVTSDRNTGSSAPYKIYEGIQNAGFSDYSDSKKTVGSTSTIGSYSSWRNKPQENEDDDLDLK